MKYSALPNQFAVPPFSLQPASAEYIRVTLALLNDPEELQKYLEVATEDVEHASKNFVYTEPADGSFSAAKSAPKIYYKTLISSVGEAFYPVLYWRTGYSIDELQALRAVKTRLSAMASFVESDARRQAAKAMKPYQLSVDEKREAEHFLLQNTSEKYLGAVSRFGVSTSRNARLLLAHAALNLIEGEEWDREESLYFYESASVKKWAEENDISRTPQFKRFLGFFEDLDEVKEAWKSEVAKDFVLNPQTGNLFADGNFETDQFLMLVASYWMGAGAALALVNSIKNERTTVLRFMGLLNAQ